MSHVKEETKSKSSNVELKDTIRESKTGNTYKAKFLNYFFASVFMEEGNSELPNFKLKVNENYNINLNKIKPEKVLKLLKNLKKKCCGPDNCHSLSPRECGGEILLPLSEIFQRPISTGDVPNDSKKPYMTCIFKKVNKQELGKYRPMSLTSVICKY